FYSVRSERQLMSTAHTVHSTRILSAASVMRPAAKQKPPSKHYRSLHLNRCPTFHNGSLAPLVYLLILDSLCDILHRRSIMRTVIPLLSSSAKFKGLFQFWNRPRGRRTHIAQRHRHGAPWNPNFRGVAQNI